MTSSHTSHQSLKWTRPLLDELCKEVQQGLEQWADEDGDRNPDHLAAAGEAARRIGGSLSVLEFDSGRLIGDTMAAVVDALASGQLDSDREQAAVKSAMEATAVLPDYLDYLENTHHDAPLVVLGTVNEMRAAIDEPAIEESEFFQPDLASVSLPDAEGEATETLDIRRQFESALKTFLVDNDNQEALAELESVGLKVRDRDDFPDDIRRTGWAAAGLSSALSAGVAVGGPELARLYARFDALLRNLADNSPTDDAEDLCRALLFQLALAGPAQGTAHDVYTAFSLAEHSPTQDARATFFLAGQNRTLFTAVTQAAREDLAQIKDTLGSQLEGESEAEVMEQQTALLESVGESLAMLGLEGMARRIRAQAERLTELSGEPDDPALLAIARELLVVESQLEDSFGRDVPDEAAEEGEQATGSLLPPSEMRRVIRQVMSEAHEDLSYAKSLLDALNRGKAEDEAATEARDVLERIANVLDMSGIDRGAQLIGAAGRMVNQLLVEGEQPAEPEQLERLAEALTVAELLLDNQGSLDDSGQRHFESIREHLESLGYWPVAADEPAAEAESEAETEAHEPPDADDERTEEAAAEESAEQEQDSPEETETAESDDSVFAVDAPAGDAGAMEDFDIVEIFLEEFDHEYETLSQSVEQWREAPNDSEIQTTIRRSFHSLKGSGRMADAAEIGDFAWQFENLLNQILENRIEPNDAVIDLVDESVRALPSLRARLSGEGEATLDEKTFADLAEQAELAAEGLLETEEESTAGGGPETEGLDPTLIELMVKELSENLETLDDWIEESEDNGIPGTIDHPLVRAVHTMKGTMRLAPIRGESETAQVLEQYLEELANAGDPPSDSGYRAIVRCQQMFHQRLGRLQGEQVDDEAFDTGDLAEVLRQLHSQAHREEAAAEDAEELLDESAPEEAEAEEAEAKEAEAEEAEEAEAEEAEAEEAEAEEAEAEEAEVEEAEAEEAEVEEAEVEEAEAEEAEVEEAEAEEAEAEEAEAEEAEAEPEDLYADLDQDLLEAFLEEAHEVLEHADTSLQTWRETPEDKALVTGLQRDLHTIKGSSRMAGLNPIGGVAHVMEELLEGIAAGLHRATADRIDAMEAGCDHLHAMVEAVDKREPMPEVDLDQIFAGQAEDIEEVEVLPDFEMEIGVAGDEDTRTARTENLRVPMQLVDDLVNYAGEISIFRSRLEEQVNVFRTNVAEVDETVIRLRDQLRKLEFETEAQILARYEREHGPADETFDPLELDRYSTIQQLSRALGESVNDLTSLTGILDDATRKSETLLMQQSRVTTELQEGLMQARMVSFNTLLPRLRRVVRNAARELEREAQLTVSVEGDGELDRSVLDRITAPIEHLLRNAVSHGIEAPEDRKQLGKPETGTIRVDVSREATELVMRITDDGGGLDFELIRKRGIEQGLIDKNTSIEDVDALARLIFRPGFSTAQQISELAGRGIGMDVVSNEIRQIGGSVAAHSESGQGTRFTIRIPLSLTVMQAIMVRVADRHFAIPLQAVRGVTRMLASEWQHQIESDEPHQEYAGERYPLIELEPQLGFETGELPEGTLSLLMIETGKQRAALRVSELQGHREIVLKPVGPQISSITGILGGTITGDGQVVPILDMGPLIRRAFDRELLPGHEIEVTETVADEHEVKRAPLVLVVDDSITMRRVTARVLEYHGLEVITARDGLDAVEAMFERVPDLILLDIEMPRMDGYELATHVRNEPRLKDVPMIMVTSRSGQKHRDHARQLGVNGYLTKPYQENDLVGQVFEHLKTAVPQG